MNMKRIKDSLKERREKYGIISRSSTVEKKKEWEKKYKEKHERKGFEDKLREIDIRKKVCPECRKKLVERDGKYGKFLGCSGYPNCKFTSNIK
jgi:hypothetical protein